MRNRAGLIFEHALKSVYCRVLFILSPKSGPRSDFLPNVVPFGLFLLSAIAYLKIAFYLCTSSPPKRVHVLSKTFRPPAPALVSFLELVRARIRNTRGIENGISLNRDTNTIEALAALHISGPHMMHTESLTNGGHRAAPVTLRQKRPGKDRDLNNPERCPRVIVRKGRSTGIRTTARDTRIGIHQSRGARKDANNPRPESERGCNFSPD